MINIETAVVITSVIAQITINLARKERVWLSLSSRGVLTFVFVFVFFPFLINVGLEALFLCLPHCGHLDQVQRQRYLAAVSKQAPDRKFFNHNAESAVTFGNHNYLCII